MKKHLTKETALVIDNCDDWDKVRRYFTGVAIDRGHYCWFIDGKLHRKDGPAIEYYNGTKSWWLNGYSYSQEEWFERLTPEQKEKAIWNMDNW